MSTIFGNAWYVRKDRIQIFLPLVDDLHFEIDRTGLGNVTANGATTYVASKFGESVVKSMVFNGSNHLTLNDVVNSLISNAVYGKGGKRTITFWSAPSDDTTLASGSMLGIDRNMILSDSYADGYGFGVDTHTSTLNPDVITQQSESYSKHILTMVKTKRITNEGNESEVEDWTGSGTAINIPTDRWIMTTYVIDHSDSSNYKMEIHLRWYDSDSGAKVHFWRKSENMNYDDIEMLQGRAINQNTIWTIGCAINANGSSNPSIYFTGKLRNIMLYNCILTDAQQNAMFANGIDPYVAAQSTNTEADEDQYDKQFWGMYGVIATESNIKVEKTIFASYSDSAFASYYDSDSASSIDPNTIFVQNKGRFGIASRDGSIVTFARDEVEESESSNPVIVDRTNYNNSFGNDDVTTNAIMAVKSAAWRGGLITGDKKLSKNESRAIWGGIINGNTDMMRIDNTIDPESLPSGKYITSWDWNNDDNDYDGGIDTLKSFLPKYYYRDRLGRSWRTKGSTANGTTKFINEIFWDKQTRYEKILWNSAIGSVSDGNPTPNGDTSITAIDQNIANDTNQISNAGNWEPVYWTIAIYEVVREPSLAIEGFASRINLTLINNDGTKLATYHKVRMRDDSYSGWMFDSFDPHFNESNVTTLENEFISRIYLPHIVIPKISIPIFNDSIEVVKDNLTTVQNRQNTIENSMKNYGNLVYFCSKDFKDKHGGGNNTTYYKVYKGNNGITTTTEPTILSDGNNQFATGINPALLTDTIIIPKTGLYEFTAMVNSYMGDNRGFLTFEIKNGDNNVKQQTTYMGDFVGGGSTGASPDTSVVKIVDVVQEGTSVKMSLNLARGINGVWIAVHFLSEWYNNDGSRYVSGVKSTSPSGDDYDAFVKQDAGGDRKHIELNNIAAYYTKTNYENNDDASLWMKNNGVNLIDIEKPSYEYYLTEDTTYQAGKTYYYKDSNGKYLVKTGYTVGDSIPNKQIYEV